MTTTIQESRLTRGEQARDHGLCLFLAHHPDDAAVGRTCELGPDSLLLGRDEDILGPGGLADGRVSRRHAVIRARAGGGFAIEDLGSSNGTSVNGVRLAAPVPLSPGDIIRLGSILLLVVRREPGFRPRAHPTLIGASPALSAALTAIERVAPHPSAVLLLGETGTGKELAARAIHDASGRRGAFCPVNCASLTDALVESELFGHERGAFSGADRARRGLAEAADGGTLFLDEIGDAPPAVQRSLLRFLQQGEVRRVGASAPIAVDARVIAATHRDLTDAARFRQDLYARLAVVTIELPPLRGRPEDIPLLARHFARARGAGARGDRSIDWRLMFALLRYAWPRNVRELEAAIARAVIESDGGALTVTPALREQLAGTGRPGGGGPAGGERADQAEPGGTVGVRQADMTTAPGAAAGVRQADMTTAPGRMATREVTVRGADTPRGRPAPRPGEHELRQLLAAHGGNVTRLAAALGRGRNTVYRWLDAAGIELARFRDGSE